MEFRGTLSNLALCLAASIAQSAAGERPLVAAELRAALAAASVHARMTATMYASTPGERKLYFAHPSSTARSAGTHLAATPGLSPDALFDTVRMKSADKTFYQAALIFAGRIPTEAERGPWATRTEFRAALRALMTGPKFHEFLLRAANDRLLTDACCFQFRGTHFVDHINQLHALRAEGGLKGEYLSFLQGATYGFQRAPLELIAHVVENDLPYTEVLTADYIMANPQAAVSYGAKPIFKNPQDVHEFQPARIERYYRIGRGHDVEYDSVGGIRVADPGPLATDYPHAGLLNAPALLYRHPTTPTNRNRARAHWTYYHLLGVDVESLGGRAIDPDALADTDNPTMNNPACTGCHALLDPVAGAFQNYDPYGQYRSSWGGKDSLPAGAKRPPYKSGDVWYRDMRHAGFEGARAPDSERSLAWLARQLAADDRFAAATVKFWWPAIMGTDVASPPTARTPTEGSGREFAGRLLAVEAQAQEVARLARGFRHGFGDGAPYNLKDLLVEIVLSPWFRADRMTDDNPTRRIALRHAGAKRPLTPEELANKTDAIGGFLWRRLKATSGVEKDRPLNAFTRDYRLIYGGIDSRDTVARSRDFNALMARVAKLHATEAGGPIVLREFLLLPDEERRLFRGIDLDATPQTAADAIRRKLVELHAKLFGEQTRIDSQEVQDAYQFLADVWQVQSTDGRADDFAGPRYGWRNDDGFLDGILDDALHFDGGYATWNKSAQNLMANLRYTAQQQDMADAWTLMLAAMLMDYRYLHL